VGQKWITAEVKSKLNKKWLETQTQCWKIQILYENT